MQFLNRNMKQRQEVGHIDLLSKFSYIEVPEGDANRVIKAINGLEYKGRTVRCNDADEAGHGKANRGESREGSRRGGDRRQAGDSRRGRKSKAERRRDSANGDWRELMKGRQFKFKDEEPDFSEEGWARRRPKKK